jgi:CheY-like chemotaxis protein
LPSTIEIRQRIDNCGLVMADSTQIHQLIMNLCTNAYQAMGEYGGILEISLKEVEITDEKASSNADFKPGRYIKLTISDTGPGMDKETQARIFEPYFTTKEVGKGTGLGLAIVHGIIKSCDGVITVYSEPREGATFNIFLPVIQTASGILELKRGYEEKAIKGNERILFVDDEEPLVRWGKAALERFGYRVTSLTNSVEALELFREDADNFDILITDMTMPNMIGSELARKIKEIRQDIPVILCTGFSELVKKKKYQGDLIQEYLSKPLIINELAIAIRKVLDTHEKQKT